MEKRRKRKSERSGTSRVYSAKDVHPRRKGGAVKEPHNDAEQAHRREGERRPRTRAAQNQRTDKRASSADRARVTGDKRAATTEGSAFDAPVKDEAVERTLEEPSGNTASDEKPAVPSEPAPPNVFAIDFGSSDGGSALSQARAEAQRQVESPADSDSVDDASSTPAGNEELSSDEADSNRPQFRVIRGAKAESAFQAAERGAEAEPEWPDESETEMPAARRRMPAEPAPSKRPPAAKKRTVRDRAQGDQRRAPSSRAEERTRTTRRIPARNADREAAKGTSSSRRNPVRTPRETEKAPAGVAVRAFIANHRMPLIVIVAVIAVLAVVGVLLWNAFSRYDDAADMQGTWYIEGTAVPVTITADKIELTDDVAYSYTIDEKNKSITFTFGQMSGQGTYYFTSNRDHLVIEDTDEVVTQSLWSELSAQSNNDISAGENRTVLSRAPDLQAYVGQNVGSKFAEVISAADTSLYTQLEDEGYYFY